MTNVLTRIRNRPDDPVIPTASSSWTGGAVYALPRYGFRREWGNEWVNAGPVHPELCVPVDPADFPLRDTVIGCRVPKSFVELATTCVPRSASVPRVSLLGGAPRAS